MSLEICISKEALLDRGCKQQIEGVFFFSVKTKKKLALFFFNQPDPSGLVLVILGKVRPPHHYNVGDLDGTVQSDKRMQGWSSIPVFAVEFYYCKNSDECMYIQYMVLCLWGFASVLRWRRHDV